MHWDVSLGAKLAPIRSQTIQNDSVSVSVSAILRNKAWEEVAKAQSSKTRNQKPEITKTKKQKPKFV